jgi:ankyrin repeat protein
MFGDSSFLQETAAGDKHLSSELSKSKHKVPGAQADDSELSEEMAWSVDEWNFDPFKLRAEPADQQMTTRSKSMLSQGTSSLKQPKYAAAYDPGEDVAVSRPALNSKSAAVCQVDGCDARLSGLKEYHQRYKICEFHLKVPSIVREGVKQRFCQQCGRFHDLASFDGDKRSCRARLQRHNARRRKKGESQQQATSKVAGAKRQATGRNSSSSSTTIAPAAVADTYMPAVPEATSTSAGGDQAEVKLEPLDSHWGSAKSFGDAALDDALADILQEGIGEREMLDKQGDPNGMFGSSFLEPSAVTSSYGSQPMPLGGGQNLRPCITTGMQGNQNMAASTGAGVQSMPYPGTMQQQQQIMQQLDMARQQGYQAALQEQGVGAMPGMLPPLPGMDHFTGFQPSAQQQQQQQMQQAAAMFQMQQGNLSAFDAARHMLMPDFSQAQAQYQAEEQLTRMSTKLYSCTPAHLPPDIKQTLVNLLGCSTNGVDGYIRPGCVHLTLNALLGDNADEVKGLGVREAVARLTAGRLKRFWGAETMLVQLNDELALVKDGEVQHVLSSSGSRGVFPHVRSIQPVCVSNAEDSTVILRGSNITAAHNAVLCRCQGRYISAMVVPPESEDAQQTPFNEALKLRLPAGSRQGAVQIEVARGGYLCEPKPVLVLADEQAVAEVRQLGKGRHPGVDVDAVLLDFDRVLEFLNNIRCIDLGINEPRRSYNRADIAAIAVTARRLLLLACTMGWPAVARMLLSLVSMDTNGDASAVVDKLDAMVPGDLNLLHAIVRTNNVELLDEMLTWGINSNHQWDATVSGPRGITPLHLAALLPSDDMLDLLTDMCPGALEAWSELRAADGHTPLDFAALSKHHEYTTLVEQKLAGELPESEDEFEFDPETGELLDSSSGAAAGNADPAIDQQQPCSVAEAVKNGKPAAVGSSTDPRSLITSEGSSERSECPSAWSTAGSSVGTSDELAKGSKLRQRHVGNDSREQQHQQQMEAAMAAASAKADNVTTISKGGKEASGIYDDYYVDCELYGIRVAPTVFDIRAALFSASLIGMVGAGTLFLRYYVEYFMD